MMKDLHCDLRPLALAIYSLATGESKESWNNLSMDDVDDRVKVAVPHLICDLILRMVDPKNQVGPTVHFISYASENFNDGFCRNLLSTPFRLATCGYTNCRKRAKEFIKAASESTVKMLAPRDLLLCMADNIQWKLLFKLILMIWGCKGVKIPTWVYLLWT